MHGAGIIESVEMKEILGGSVEYFLVKLASGNLEIMVPVDKCETVGVRHIVSRDVIERVYEVLQEETSDMAKNWNKRLRENMDSLKTGDILKVAAVVRNLTRTDRIKKLSTGEKKMLNNATQILESEISLSVGITIEEAKLKVNSLI